MTTISRPTDNSAQTWRDLADQLTPAQCKALTRSEAHFAAGGIAERQEAIDANLDFARDYVEQNHIDAQFADVPIPAGAKIETGPFGGWEKDLEQAGWSRSVTWREFSVGNGVDLSIDGRQRDDGSFSRKISLWLGEGAELNSDDARSLGAMLIQAADEMDSL